MSDPATSDVRFRLALRAARQGVWEFDLRSGQGFRSAELRELLGVNDAQPTLAGYLTNVDPQDRALVLGTFERLRSGLLDESELQYRFVRDDGRVLWVEQHTYVERDGSGAAVRLFGLTRDITSFKRIEDELQQLNSSLERRVEERTRELDVERASLSAFAQFAEAVGTETDVAVLARQALAVLSAHFPAGSGAYYEKRGDRWCAVTWTEELAAQPDLLATLRSGLTEDTPVISALLAERGPVFLEHWDAETGRIAHTEAYGVTAGFPVMVRGQVRALLGVALRSSSRWSERDRAIFRAVGRSLNLAFERADDMARLARQHAELDAKSRALEGFAELTRDLAYDVEPSTFVQRAQEVALSLIPVGFATYFEPDADRTRWVKRVQTGEVHSDALQAMMDAGLPFEETRSFIVPWRTLEPLYQDEYTHDGDVVPSVVSHIRTGATLPVLSHGRPVGVFAVALFEGRSWTATDRAVLETLVRSLGLALERTEGTRQLAAQRDVLAARTTALQAANEELEAFAYSVSHDLRTPVRHMTAFGDLLRRSLGERLDDRSERYLSVVERAAAQMNVVIDAMLGLSRTSRQALQRGPVDLSEVVASARSEMMADLPDRAVTWRVEPLPVVPGDAALLRQVVENLLSNALKYTRTREVAVVEVWAEERPTQWAVFVRDNGVGFDPKYTAKLFGVFQRLHREDEFEGTGVGLANVRRIVTRHDGQVFAQGEPGVGATFGFTLPRTN